MLIEKLNLYKAKSKCIGGEDCDMYLGLLEEMIDYAKDYVDVCSNQSKLSIIVLDEKEIHKRILDLEEPRSLAHNAFIGSVNAVNRACDRINCERIYEGGNHRLDYAEFAINIVNELFKVRP